MKDAFTIKNVMGYVQKDNTNNLMVDDAFLEYITTC